MKKCSPRSAAEESAEEANVQRKKKKVLDEEKGNEREREERRVDRTEERRAPSISRNTVATPKVYHSGAQSVGCSWDVRTPCRNTMETVG